MSRWDKTTSERPLVLFFVCVWFFFWPQKNRIQQTENRTRLWPRHWIKFQFPMRGIYKGVRNQVKDGGGNLTSSGWIKPTGNEINNQRAQHRHKRIFCHMWGVNKALMTLNRRWTSWDICETVMNPPEIAATLTHAIIPTVNVRWY